MKQQTIEWQEVELGNICEIKKGKSITKSIIVNGDIPVIAGGQQPAYYHNISNRSGETLTVSGSGAYAGFVAYFNIPIFASDCSTIQAGSENIFMKYVYYFLKGNQNKIYKLQKGIAQPHVYPKDLEKIKIPLPPLQVQKQIVSILEKAEKLKQKRDEADRLTKEYLQSVFYEMFLNKGFEEKSIKELCEVISGSTPSTSKEEYWNGNIDWITPAELEDGDNYYYYNSERKITEKGLQAISGRLFPKETVMLTTRAPIGKVAIAGKQLCTNQGFKNMVCGKELNPVYLYSWFLLNKEYLNSLGVGATFKEISKKIVENIKIPLPPLPLQQKFASIVEQVEKMKENVKKTKTDSEELFNSLMTKAFRGEL